MTSTVTTGVFAHTLACPEAGGGVDPAGAGRQRALAVALGLAHAIVCKPHTESLTLTNAMTEALVINSVVILGGE